MVFMRNINRKIKSNLDFWILCCNYIVSGRSVLGLFVIFLICLDLRLRGMNEKVTNNSQKLLRRLEQRIVGAWQCHSELPSACCRYPPIFLQKFKKF